MSDARFTLLPNALLSPGGCLLSGSPGPVVDTGHTIEWFPANAVRPRVYLSVDIIRELADVAGVRGQSQHEALFEAQAYNRGYMDAVKEHVGDQLVELVDRLGLLSALLGGSDSPDPADVQALGEGAGPAGPAGGGEDDDAAGDRGPSGRARGKQRRADVLGNPAAGVA